MGTQIDMYTKFFFILVQSILLRPRYMRYTYRFTYSPYLDKKKGVEDAKKFFSRNNIMAYTWPVVPKNLNLNY